MIFGNEVWPGGMGLAWQVCNEYHQTKIRRVCRVWGSSPLTEDAHIARAIEWRNRRQSDSIFIIQVYSMDVVEKLQVHESTTLYHRSRLVDYYGYFDILSHFMHSEECCHWCCACSRGQKENATRVNDICSSARTNWIQAAWMGSSVAMGLCTFHRWTTNDIIYYE